MSTFGDNTPADEMLDYIRMVQIEKGLTDAEVLTVLLVIAQWYQDANGFDFESIQKK